MYIRFIIDIFVITVHICFHSNAITLHSKHNIFRAADSSLTGELSPGQGSYGKHLPRP